MKKFLALFLSAVLVLSSTACSTKTSPTTSEEPTETAYTAGTYTGTATGHSGPVSVSVTLSDSAIESIEVVESAETSGIGDVAATAIIKDILDNQSLDVDAVTGCTVSANAFRNAIEAALESAGADVATLQKAPKKQQETTTETLDVDVVVVGSGAAGLMAALEAAQVGSKVVVLEKLSRNGGATRTSSGMIVAGGTVLQEEAGIEDSTQNLKDYWTERGEGNIDTEMMEFVADNINECLNEFLDMGVSYSTSLILQSGTATINRAHMPSGSGAELCDVLDAELEKLGVEILVDTAAESLIQNEQGEVVGVNATTKTGTLTVNAKATILATGGFGGNAEMIAEYSPKAIGTWSCSSPGSTGDGITMGLEVGADTVFKGGFIGWKVCTPAYDHTTAIGAPVYGAANLIVNQEGNRFGNENLDYPFVYNAMEEDGSDKFYFIFESGSEDTVDLTNNVSNTVANLELGVEAGVAYKGETLEELAEVSGLSNLVATVEKYNSAIEQGEDTEFGRNTETMTSIATGPFYALESRRATLGTFGGLNTNITGEVVNAEGQAISGLYAAGEVANGEFFPVIYPASGSAISMAVVLGKEAGKSAAAYASTK